MVQPESLQFFIHSHHRPDMIAPIEPEHSYGPANQAAKVVLQLLRKGHAAPFEPGQGAPIPAGDFLQQAAGLIQLGKAAGL
jgi:hypothetical protein